MDKVNAIKLTISYLSRLRTNNVNFSEAWLFGSYAKGNFNENSDIDLAIVLDDEVKYSFDTEVKLMGLRLGEETLIEPHPFSKDDFKSDLPIIKQIIRYGERIKI
jgi:predicted nucleotidyltransferase